MGKAEHVGQRPPRRSREPETRSTPVVREGTCGFRRGASNPCTRPHNHTGKHWFK